MPTLRTEIAVRNLSGRAVDAAPLAAAARSVLAAEGRELAALSLALVDDERISALNRRLLDHEGPTDVIAFEADEGEGEVIVSVETAQRQAAEAGQSLMAELRFLVAHGVLHVCGWDDTTPAARDRMIERQHEILASN